MRTVSRRFVAAGLAALMFVPVLGPAATPLELSPRGLQFRDLQEGDGAPLTEGEVARIHLVMWIDEQGQRGQEVYNSRGDREPVSFVVGSTAMMPALNEGVLGMKPGGRRMLLVPPAFAYGNEGLADVVPPEASLIVLVDLISREPTADP